MSNAGITCIRHRRLVGEMWDIYTTDAGGRRPEPGSIRGVSGANIDDESLQKYNRDGYQ